MKFNVFLTVVLTIATSLVNFGQSAKILAVYGFPAPSHYIFVTPLLKALAKRGHEVTSISLYSQEKPMTNFKDIPIMENFNLFDDLFDVSAEKGQNNFLTESLKTVEIGQNVATNIFENSQVQTLMANETFDLIITEVMGTDSVLGFGQHFNAPIVVVSIFGALNFIDSMVGNPIPSSFIPHMALPFGNHMSLLERAINAVTHALDQICFSYIVFPPQEKLYKKYFPTAKLTLQAARKNVSLVMINDHFSLIAPRPFVPNIIPVAGMHIQQQPSESLPEDLQIFLDNAVEGVIYFSMGSIVKTANLPAKTLKTFLKTFREMNIKVLWKFETEELPDKPDNVLIRKWFPQQSVLAHPNIKLCISHGGILSTLETIFHEKPLLGLPVLGEQIMNVKNAVKAGYAVTLNLRHISKESLKAAILELWNNDCYAKAVQCLSKHFRDRPMEPLETAIYWVEYVLRHEGASHMRNAGQDLSIMEYYNIDAYFICIAVIVTVLVILIAFMILLMKLFWTYFEVARTAMKSKLKLN